MLGVALAVAVVLAVVVVIIIIIIIIIIIVIIVIIIKVVRMCIHLYICPGIILQLHLLYFSVHPTVPSIHLPSTIVENTETSLNCTIDRVKPKTATIHWVLAGTTYNGNTVSTPDNGVYKLVNTWTHTFSRQNHSQQLQCVVTPLAGQGNSQTGTATLDVYCKYYDRGTVKQEQPHLMYTVSIMTGEQSNRNSHI